MVGTPTRFRQAFVARLAPTAGRVAERTTISRCTSSTSFVARTARCTPAMPETRVHANGRTTAAVARSTRRAGVRGEATRTRAEGRIGRQRETPPSLNHLADIL